MANNPFLADVPHRHYLREWRLKRGLKQKDLAQKIGISETEISRFETGERGISMELQFKLFNALDIMPGQFFAPPDALDLNALARDASAKKRRRIVKFLQLIMDEPDGD